MQIKTWGGPLAISLSDHEAPLSGGIVQPSSQQGIIQNGLKTGNGTLGAWLWSVLRFSLGSAVLGALCSASD